jgi:hypothetical protein
MNHMPINHSETPIRLFQSDFLEFFSHISPVTVTVIWLPVAVFIFVRPIIMAGALTFFVPVGFVLFSDYTTPNITCRTRIFCPSTPTRVLNVSTAGPPWVSR